MKTVLVAMNAKYIHSNLAVYSLRAYAEAYKEYVEIAEYTINQHMDDVLRDLYTKKADILCFSCYIWNRTYLEELIREIKKVQPEVVIWLGGPEVSYDACEVLERLPEAVGVMLGEGEETFCEIMEHYYDQKLSLKEIAGIAYRDERNEIVQNPWREVMDMSKIPFVYDEIEKFENKIIYYESSRGCPFSCSYCLSSVDKCLRFRDLELVKNELQFFIDHKIPQVKFVDRTFNCNHKHAKEIWTYLMEHDKGITNFHFEVAADLLNEEELSLIEKMRPGLIQLEIGVQSTNEQTIREIRRTMKFSAVSRIVQRINKNQNVHQHLDLIAGLPYEDLESFKNSFRDVYNLHPEQLQLGFLKVLKGSYMDEKKEDYKLVYKSQPPYEVLSTAWLSYDDLLELKLVENMLEVYHNSGQFSYTLARVVQAYENPYDFYLQLGKYYEENGLLELNHTRVRRYEILLDFIRGQALGDDELYRELLTLDLYLRENVKNRPTFAGEYTVSKELKRQYSGMVHLERFQYDVMGDCSKKEQMFLFDYENRSKMNRQASCKILSKSLQ